MWVLDMAQAWGTTLHRHLELKSNNCSVRMANSVNSNEAVLSLHYLADPIFLTTVLSLYNTPV